MVMLLQAPSDSSVAALRALLRAEAPYLVLGIVLVVVGAITLLLFAARRETRDLVLLAFAGFSGPYGLRLLAGQGSSGMVTGLSEQALRTIGADITYVILPPAAAFFERMLGLGRHSVLRACLWLSVAFSAVAVTLDAWLGVRGVLMAANNGLVIVFMLVIMVNLFFRPPRVPGLPALRLGSTVLGCFALGENLAGLGFPVWERGQEVIGFFFFTCCLGYAAAQHVAANERKLLAVESELETARRIQSSILPRDAPQVPGLAVTVRYQPMTAVAGDFYDFLRPDGESLGILVADVAGHGVPAALIASMVKVAVAAQMEHAASPERVLAGMNAVFSGQRLDGQYLTAGYLFVDVGRRVGRYAGAGHPPLLVWRATERRLERVESNGLILGPFRTAAYASVEFPLADGDRLILCTDGVLEACDAAGAFFGDGPYQRFVADQARLPGDPFADALLRAVARWSGGGDAASLADDLTLLVVDFRPAAGA